MRKYLVIQTASIGDVILVTPVIEKLHQHFPHAHIDLLLKKGNESLFKGHPFLHKILVWDKKTDKYKNFRDLLHIIRDTQYDGVINLQRFASTGFLTASSGAKQKIGFNKNPFSLFFTKRIKHTIREGNRHEVERNLDLVRDFTSETPSPIKLYPTVANFAKMSQYKTVKYITLSPASLWFTKQYPKEKWIDFLTKLDNDIQVYFLGAANDKALCNEIIKLSNHANSLNLSGKLSFLESAALMKNAAMNYMNDSAPLHLASSVNAKTTAIFCSTITGFGFGPLSDDSVVVETKEKLNCRPCGLHGLKNCPKKHFKCAVTIDNQELLNRL
ncbi:MAG: glycosyltransferase family 9 protein [Bacteroidetes bacterium]|nr:MAG: glycosyltransferase family 9 protein [Bacteroidota bacterium]